MQGPPGIPGPAGTCQCDVSMTGLTDMMETIKRQSVDSVLTAVHQHYRDVLKKMNKRISVLENLILSKFS